MTDPDPIAQELQQTIVQELVPVAHAIAQASQQPENKLMSVEAHAKQIEHELSQYMLLAKKRIADGFLNCIEAVKELARLDSEINLEVLQQDLTASFSRLDSVAVIKDMSSKVVEGNTWKELLGLSDKTLDLLYLGAKSLFDQGHHPKAEAAFFFLTTVDYAQYSFWLGLGHAAFHLGNLNQAINAYETAEECRPDAIWPHIFVANCFEALNDYQEALLALEEAQAKLISLTEKDPHLEADLHERIAVARQKA